jgi:hypothetical protein
LKKTASRTASEIYPHTRYVGGREILIPASVRLAREKAAEKMRVVREKAAARAQRKAAREEREIARAAMKIARALDRKAARMEREAARLDRKAQRIAFMLARKDRLQEQLLMQRARRAERRKRKGAVTRD